MKWKQVIFVCCVAGFSLACTPRAVREAERVVAQADSLRAEGRMYGIDEGDSLTLAQAYETLSSLGNPILSALSPQLSAGYAHACYHYGRLLREKDHPVEAMQVFINATHTNTRDFHILARTYSNMGNLCHLGNEYALSAKMYELSARNWLSVKDTLNYQFAQYRIAFEYASLTKEDTCLRILKNIECNNVQDSLLRSCCLLTRAELCLRNSQYDSTIQYAHQALLYQETMSTALIQLAQAFSYLGEKDSATYYADIVSHTTKDLFELNNALYILTNDDETTSKAAIRQVASDRADVQKLLEIRQGKLSQATQLLWQDLERLPDRKWVFVLVSIIMLLSGILGLFYAYRRFRLIKKNDSLMRATIEQKCDALNSLSDKQLEDTIYWKDYNSLCHFMNGHMNGIISKLLQVNSHLTEQNIRLCVVTIIGCSYNRSAEMLRLSKSSISKSKQIVADKLGTDIKSLRTFLLEISCKNV